MDKFEFFKWGGRGSARVGNFETRCGGKVLEGDDKENGGRYPISIPVPEIEQTANLLH